jgi:hypothetical protein
MISPTSPTWACSRSRAASSRTRMPVSATVRSKQARLGRPTLISTKFDPFPTNSGAVRRDDSGQRMIFWAHVRRPKKR